MAKSFAPVDVIFIIWWTDLAIISWSLWIYETEIAILFLTLASKTISMISWFTSESL